MKAACFLYTLLLLLEGALAWMLDGEAWLLVVSTLGLALYAALHNIRRGPAEGVRFFAAAALVIGAPFHYPSQSGLLLCFIALPHYLAATQSIWEISWGSTSTTHELRKMRSVVFSVAFYASMALVFLLLRGVRPLEPWQSGVLALTVVAAALPAWDASRLLRLKAGRPDTDAEKPAASRVRSWLGLGGTLVALVALFAFALPPVSQFLCQISPRWKSPDIDFRNRPPHKPPMGDETRLRNTAEQQTGLDASSNSGSHQLPSRANIKPEGDIRGFLHVPDAAQATRLAAAGPVYLRSHTFNRFLNNTWTPTTTQGTWIADADDGVTDNVINLAPVTPAATRYELFLYQAAGTTTPALPGLQQISLPRVYSVPGDLLQHEFTGDIRYSAVSEPIKFDLLPDIAQLRPGDDPQRINLGTGDEALTAQLQQLASGAMDHGPLLADRIADLRKWFRDHYQYSLTIENPQKLSPLENFLLVERKGYCDFYAAGSALLLRSAGIPSRVAYGYALTDHDPAARAWPVTGRNAHAWTEILVEGKGWVICDFTPAEDIGNLGGKPQEPDKTDFDPSKFTPPVPPPPAPDADSPARALTSFTPDFHLPDWFPIVKTWILPVLGGAAVVALCSLFFRKRAEEKKRAAAAAVFDEKQPVYYRELVRICTEAGHPRAEGATPREYLASLQAAGVPLPEQDDLLAYHYQIRYENAAPDPARESSFLTAVMDLARILSLRSQDVPS